MSLLLQNLHGIAATGAERVALQGTGQSLTYGELDLAVAEAAYALHAEDFRAIGLLADNGLPWALADLAALAANIPLVPLPLFEYG